MALSGAFCYGELAARFPRDRWRLCVSTRGLRSAAWFPLRLEVLSVMDPGLTAALAVGMASYVGYIVPLCRQQEQKLLQLPRWLRLRPPIFWA